MATGALSDVLEILREEGVSCEILPGGNDEESFIQCRRTLYKLYRDDRSRNILAELTELDGKPVAYDVDLITELAERFGVSTRDDLEAGSARKVAQLIKTSVQLFALSDTPTERDLRMYSFGFNDGYAFRVAI